MRCCPHGELFSILAHPRAVYTRYMHTYIHHYMYAHVHVVGRQACPSRPLPVCLLSSEPLLSVVWASNLLLYMRVFCCRRTQQQLRTSYVRHTRWLMTGGGDDAGSRWLEWNATHDCNMLWRWVCLSIRPIDVAPSVCMYTTHCYGPALVGSVIAWHQHIHIYIIYFIYLVYIWYV